MIEEKIKKYLSSKNVKNDTTKRYLVTRDSSILGIFSNICLFVIKILLGLFTKSISIISDAFNNLSDSLSFFISLLGLHFAKKPADKEHPFGHGRVEYIVSFILTIIIFVAGFEFLTESFKRIINPTPINKSLWTIILLLLTIAVKLFLSFYFNIVGVEIDSLILKASSKDSLNDVLITSVVLGAIILSYFNNRIPFDGIAGIIVSLFIFASGYDLIKSTITRLLGSRVDEELLNEIKMTLLDDDNIFGVHDVIVHDYGPSVKMGSGHVEMSNKLSLDEAHIIIDKLELMINKKYGVDFSIHIDPINIEDKDYKKMYEKISKILRDINEDLTLHDLSLQDNVLSFDIEVPFGIDLEKQDIKNKIKSELKEICESCQIELTFDIGFTTARK